MEEITDAAICLKKLRQEKGLTLKAMGDLAGLTESGIWRIENRGSSGMYVPTLIKILHALDKKLYIKDDNT